MVRKQHGKDDYLALCSSSAFLDILRYEPCQAEALNLSLLCDGPSPDGKARKSSKA